MPCSACGLSKRHLFNQAALDGGYDVVATGHNLDDEAAVLFGNVLRWDTELPRPPAAGAARPRHGFARKVKPLVRLAEREMAAYCVLRGIDYIVEECPMAAGNRHLGYKDALNAIEATSPGLQARLLLRASSTGSRRCSGPLPSPSGSGLQPCAGCGVADHRRGVRLLHAGRSGDRSGGSAGPGSAAARPDGRRRASGPVGPVSRPFAAGDRVLLFDSKSRRYLVTLAEGGEFHTHAGPWPTTT